jgi:DNA polymerase-3 subunit epsilon
VAGTQAWLSVPWLTFDVESTGVDTDTDRIVTAALLRVPAGATEPDRAWEWVVDPGVPIPEEAAEVHGFTTERARREGSPPDVVLRQLTAALGGQWNAATPLVVANAPFDLSLLDAECRRHVGRPLRLTGYVLDPMVIDRNRDKFRKGSRKLGDLCAHYGVELTEAHACRADALAALLVTRALVDTFARDLTIRSLVELHHFQKAWRREWAVGYQAYARTQARQSGASEAEVAEIVIDTAWPIRDRTPVGTS